MIVVQNSKGTEKLSLPPKFKESLGVPQKVACGEKRKIAKFGRQMPDATDERGLPSSSAPGLGSFAWCMQQGEAAGCWFMAKTWASAPAKGEVSLPRLVLAVLFRTGSGTEVLRYLVFSTFRAYSFQDFLELRENSLLIVMHPLANDFWLSEPAGRTLVGADSFLSLCTLSQALKADWERTGGGTKFHTSLSLFC